MTTRSTRGPRRRTAIVTVVILAILAVFVIRLTDIQVVSAREHIADAMSFGLGDSKKLVSKRGTIVDADGTVLATSVLQYNCQLDPKNAGKVKTRNADGTSTVTQWPDIAAKIGAITGQTTAEVEKIVSDALATNPDSHFAYLKKGLTTDQYRKLMELGAGYISCFSASLRTYPNGAVAGNLLGFMGDGGKALAGLEMSQNQCLSGTDGLLTFEKGKDGVIIPGSESEAPAVDGGTVKLTIDSDLQWYMGQLIQEQVQDTKSVRGTITVVDIKTGKIKAAAEYPTVDPNNVSASAAEDRRSHIFTDTFEPGSTFKGLTASALIDGASQTPLSTAQVTDVMHFPNGAVVKDATGHGLVNYTLAGVLINSSNAGISKFSERMSLDLRYAYLKKFGIGDGSAIGFPGEAKGLIHPAKEWDNQMRYDTSYGQGLTTTVPELMSAYTAIADGGMKMPLQLVESCTRGDGTVVTPKLPAPTRVISEQTSADMREILENVAMQASYSKIVQIPGYRIATKTGTAQQVDPVTHRYRAGLYFTTMIGFAPADDPQYLVAVTLDSPSTVRSSTANAPAFQKAMTQVLKTYRVMPSTTAPTELPQFG
ncbi:peptidoglycan D,D-transpeptidase FtsI family protein [Microbacterium sp. ASV49]|uniref:Penicillin-binding protein 2 n=1 Tax=Microbacterium candidum TaxID=3041922 RepID=A0ABT7N3X3_9MICO|nr:penicillin-binding protein 2 [Microbacterium sp. ASV49]MDL9981411.1 penicillin-binding protein 2 [Microbacterium sp. ASV49]